MKKKTLRSIAEDSFLKKEFLDNQKLEGLSPEEISIIIHDLEVYKIELEMQNEELQRTQTELKNTKIRYFDLYDLAPVGYLVISEKGIILEANLTAANMLGQVRGDLIKRRLSQYIYDQDDNIYYSHKKALFESLLPQEYELRLIRSDGTTFWANIKVTVAIEENKKTSRMIVSNITERKQLELQLQQSMEDLLESQRIAHLGTWRLDLATNQVVWSEELYKMYGFDPTIPPPPYTEHMKLFTPDSWERLSKSIDSTRTYGIPYELQLKTVKIDGSNGWMWVRGEATKDSTGKIVFLWGAAQDITEQKQIETQLRQSEELIQATLVSVGDGVISCDVQGKVQFLNPVAERMTGWTQEEAHGIQIEEVFNIYNESTGEKGESIARLVLETGKILGIANHTILVSKYGEKRPIEDSAAPIIMENGDIIGVVIVFSDFTEKRKSIEEIEYLSYHDYLTGLYNRRYFEEEMNRYDVSRNYPISIIMGDVNGLKLINDSFGHAIGDKILKKSAELMVKACREDDIVSRIGGDEFVILLPKTDVEDVAGLIKRLQDSIANELIEEIPLSISFGQATKTKDGEHLSEILKEAEDHMYRHKLYESTGSKSKTVNLIINTLYAKNYREMLHSQRVSVLSESIATSLGFSLDDVKQIKTAGLMHDIGKIGIEDRILNKTEQLNQNEWDEIKKHCEIGYRILSSVNEFSEIADFVLEHQERWDGTGYPRGLKGDEISKEARIITVADSFDAMTGERTYGRSYNIQEAINELYRCSGTQFDPEIVKVFVDSLKKK